MNSFQARSRIREYFPSMSVTYCASVWEVWESEKDEGDYSRRLGWSSESKVKALVHASDRIVTPEQVFSWKEELSQRAILAFGYAGAICNLATYEKMRRECVITQSPSSMFSHLAAVPLNSFNVSVDETVPDGILIPARRRP